MIIAAEYSFNGGESVKETHPQQLQEVENIITSINASLHKTKESKEKTMPGKMLYHPSSLNGAFTAGFDSKHWQKKIRIPCDYPTNYYRPGYSPKPMGKRTYREMDFLKDRLGVEVQFGKYAFMVYNVCSKMTIFHNEGFIDAGIEIVPVKSLATEMSTGVSYFEQFVWDLEKRGVGADIDIPVLIYGIDVGDENVELETQQSLFDYEEKS